MHVFAAAALACLSVQDSPPLVIADVNVVPVHAPGVLEHQSVLIQDGRIVRIAATAEVEVPEGARIVDGAGRWLIPGFADMHEHIPRGGHYADYPLEDYFDLQLAAGVTTMRSMRGALEDIELRATVESGEREGPRMILGSPGINSQYAPDVETACQNVRDFHAAGFDFIKILGGFDVDTFDALAETARELGIPIGGHWPSGVPLENGLDAPFWSVEHLHEYRGRFERDPEAFDELARVTAELGIWICPTIGFQVSWYTQEPLEDMLRWPGVDYASPEAIGNWSRKVVGRLPADAETQAQYDAQIESIRGAVRALADADVGLLVSPSGGWFLVPGFSMYLEFRCLAECGLSPEEVLTAATINAARSVGEEDAWGSVREGLAADLVLLDANPLERILVPEDVRAVVRAGELFEREELDARLARIREGW